MDYELQQRLVLELQKINKNLAEIDETLKVLAVQINEMGGKQ